MSDKNKSGSTTFGETTSPLKTSIKIDFEKGLTTSGFAKPITSSSSTSQQSNSSNSNSGNSGSNNSGKK